MNDLRLIETFVDSSVQRKDVLLATSNLCAETAVGVSQLSSRKEGLLALIKLGERPQNFMVKNASSYWAMIHQTMLHYSFCPAEPSTRHSFYNYKYQTKPEGYALQCTTANDLWKIWWLNQRRNGPLGNIDLLVLNRGTWYPVKEMSAGNGMISVKTLVGELYLNGSDTLVWLQKEPSSEPESNDEVEATEKRPSIYSRRYLGSRKILRS